MHKSSVMCLDFPGGVFFHQIIFSQWNMNFIFNCCPKISGCLLTLTCSLCYRDALPNFVHTSAPLLGLPDRSTVNSPRACIPALSGPSDLLYVYCAINSNIYCTLLHKSQVQLTQKYQSPHTEISEPCIHSVISSMPCLLPFTTHFTKKG